MSGESICGYYEQYPKYRVWIRVNKMTDKPKINKDNEKIPLGEFLSGEFLSDYVQTGATYPVDTTVNMEM
jgi:hypothetical protein